MPLEKGRVGVNGAPFPDRMVLFLFLPDAYLSYPGRLSFICWGMYLFCYFPWKYGLMSLYLQRNNVRPLEKGQLGAE